MSQESNTHPKGNEGVGPAGDDPPDSARSDDRQGAEADGNLANVTGEQEPQLDAPGSAGDQQGDPARVQPETGTRRDAAAAVGDRYAEQSTAGVTNVYVSDNRTIGVSIEGTVTAQDIVGRDKKTVPEGKSKADRQRTRLVSVVTVARQDREKLSRVAIRVSQYGQARAILERERLVVLHGPAGVGKGTAGLSLLGFDQEILSVDPSISTRDLADFKKRFAYGRNRRYLLEALSSVTAAQLSGFVTRTIRRDLNLAKSYLVITIDERIPLSADLASYVVQWSERPDTEMTLRRHLAYYLADDSTAAVEKDFDLSQLAQGLAERGLGGVDQVARSVVSAFKESRSFESLLDDLGFGAQARIASWFEAERSQEEIALLLSIAVLGGCPYHTVVRHARRLEELIAELSRRPLSKRPLDPLEPRSARLRAAMAVLESGFVDTEYGQSPAVTVRLENRWLVHAVLDVVWEEYDLIASALLGWLYEAGDDPDPAIRLRVAAAAGWLSQYDFATLRRELFVPWACGSSEAARAAADALGQAAWIDSTAPLALGLINVWSEQDNYDLWWTATVAYGGEIGVRLPNVAMDQLLAIALRDDDRVQLLVANCVVRLITSGGRFASDISTYALNHLNRWLKYSLAAALTAQQIYVELLSRAGDPDWPSAPQYWRLLIARDNLVPSASLLRATLAERSFRKEALIVLEVLVRAGDQDDVVRSGLAELLQAVTASPGATNTDKERLVYYLQRWAEAKEPSATAQVIVSRLQGI